LLGCIAAKHEHEFGYDRANPAQVFQDTYVENQGDEARSLMYPDGAPSATTPSEYPQDLSPRKLELFSGVTPQPTKMD